MCSSFLIKHTFTFMYSIIPYCIVFFNLSYIKRLHARCSLFVFINLFQYTKYRIA